MSCGFNLYMYHLKRLAARKQRKKVKKAPQKIHCVFESVVAMLIFIQKILHGRMKKTGSRCKLASEPVIFLFWNGAIF